jgi:hypothetical protein
MGDLEVLRENNSVAANQGGDRDLESLGACSCRLLPKMGRYTGMERNLEARQGSSFDKSLAVCYNVFQALDT